MVATSRITVVASQIDPLYSPGGTNVQLYITHGSLGSRESASKRQTASGSFSHFAGLIFVHKFNNFMHYDAFYWAEHCHQAPPGNNTTWFILIWKCIIQNKTQFNKTIKRNTSQHNHTQRKREEQSHVISRHAWVVQSITDLGVSPNNITFQTPVKSAPYLGIRIPI